MDAQSKSLQDECLRLEETCLYTSTSFFIWLRFCRNIKIAFIITPLILGSLGTWSVLTRSDFEHLRTITAVFTFLAGLLPAIYAALKLDSHLDQCCKLAGEFKNMQDRFRQAALISSQKSTDEFERDVQPLFDRLETARAQSFTVPEWCFKRARKKINKGDYTYGVDIESGAQHGAVVRYMTADRSDEGAKKR
jgi:hypothetical protein